jgi:hypothetical protein
MKHLIVIATLVFVSNAHADILFGKMKGQDKNGQACEIEVLTKYYTDNTPHPLNERISVKFEGSQWELAHPAVIKEADSQVRFDHSFFQQIIAKPTGAASLVMAIDHEAEPHAATSFVMIDDNYRDASKSRKISCANLTLVK